MNQNIQIYKTIQKFEEAATLEISNIINDAINKRGTCMVALSGGETPIGVYRRLSAEQIGRAHV
jgi:6-phosphogluconolactonase/glucosamine-6-phosphate isomerase/deaminase